MWIYVYDNNVRKSISKIYYWWISGGDSYVAMQWPCPSGFHVPMSSEWQSILDSFTDKWYSWTQITTLFVYFAKIPLAWYRDYTTWATHNQDGSSMWAYWCCTWNNYRNIEIASNPRTTNYYEWFWVSIRPFKDTPVAPDSSWTDELWLWLIYWNSSLWLVSISLIWWWWITMADKNLWATQVYNISGEIVATSQATCWNYYQWGNNYWFPRTWSLTTSSTTVDTTGYWPWNYYSSSTYILNRTWWGDIRNPNLRWWTTWITPIPTELTKLYKWNTLIRQKS